MLKSDDLSVGTSAVELTQNIDVDQEYALHIVATDSGFTIGDASVTPTNGVPVPAEPLRLQSGTRVYGVFASGTHAVHVLAYSA